MAMVLVQSASGQSLFINDVHIVDVENGALIEHQDIWIERGVIKEMGPDLVAPDGISHIDGRGQYAIPGLIDAHIHLFQSGGLYTRPDAIDLRHIRPYEDELKWLSDHAGEILQSYLHLGITTVVDVGGPMANYAIRDQHKDEVGYPNLYLTGPLISTYQPKELTTSDPPIIKVHTEEEAREMVRAQLPYQPDFIKIWYISLPTLPADQTYQIVQAAVDESHSHGLAVAIHATQLMTAKLAIKAGADVLVHSVSQPIDSEFIDMILANDVTYVPTLLVHGNYTKAFGGQLEIKKEDHHIVHPEVIASLLDVHHLDEVALNETRQYYQEFRSQELRQDSIRQDNLLWLAERGVRIATGTDAGNIGTLHAASYHNELDAMHLAGLSPGQILKASTLGAAHAAQAEDLLGSIAQGKIADILLLKDNPLHDINNLKYPDVIIKGGLIVDQKVNPYSHPQELAQLQLNAYNAGDIEAFIAPYSDSVRVYNFPDQLLYTGKDIMRQNYSIFFDRTPDLHCELINRMVLGNTVIDQERVTGLGGGRTIEAIAIYKIAYNKIQEVYFDRGQ